MVILDMKWDISQSGTYLSKYFCNATILVIHHCLKMKRIIISLIVIHNLWISWHFWKLDFMKWCLLRAKQSYFCHVTVKSPDAARDQIDREIITSDSPRCRERRISDRIRVPFHLCSWADSCKLFRNLLPTQRNDFLGRQSYLKYFINYESYCMSNW